MMDPLKYYPECQFGLPVIASFHESFYPMLQEELKANYDYCHPKIKVVQTLLHSFLDDNKVRIIICEYLFEFKSLAVLRFQNNFIKPLLKDDHPMTEKQVMRMYIEAKRTLERMFETHNPLNCQYFHQSNPEELELEQKEKDQLKAFWIDERFSRMHAQLVTVRSYSNCYPHLHEPRKACFWLYWLQWIGFLIQLPTQKENQLNYAYYPIYIEMEVTAAELDPSSFSWN